jgi:hypothetical protein
MDWRGKKRQKEKGQWTMDYGPWTMERKLDEKEWDCREQMEKNAQ